MPLRDHFQSPLNDKHRWDAVHGGWPGEIVRTLFDILPPALYAVTLRTRKPWRKRPMLDAWYYPLNIGQSLPTIPLWLTPDLPINLPLEPSYQEVCRLLRIA